MVSLVSAQSMLRMAAGAARAADRRAVLNAAKSALSAVTVRTRAPRRRVECARGGLLTCSGDQELRPKDVAELAGVNDAPPHVVTLVQCVLLLCSPLPAPAVDVDDAVAAGGGDAEGSGPASAAARARLSYILSCAAALVARVCGADPARAARRRYKRNFALVSSLLPPSQAEAQAGVAIMATPWSTLQVHARVAICVRVYGLVRIRMRAASTACMCGAEGGGGVGG